MSTRANIIIRDQNTELFFYRHSDGYPSECGEDLKDFVQGYTKGKMRPNASQSAGWLIVRGYFGTHTIHSPLPDPKDRFSGWKVGDYEPTDRLHADVEYVYVINPDAGTLQCFTPKKEFWDDPTLENCRLATEEFPTVSFYPLKAVKS